MADARSVSRRMSHMCSHAASMCKVLWHACSLCLKETCQTCAVMPPPCVRYYGRHAPFVSRRHVTHVQLCRLHVLGIMACMLPLWQEDMSNMCSYTDSMCEVLWHACSLCIKETCHTCAVMPPPCLRYDGMHAPSV
jgi:hypothetical protein